MGCCLSKLTKNYFASAMAANEMSKKIGMMGKYAPKEMKEGRSTYPGPTMEHLEEGLDILVGKMTSINEEAQEIVKNMDDKGDKASKLRFYQLEQFLLWIRSTPVWSVCSSKQPRLPTWA